MTQSPFLLYSFLPICQSYFRLNRKFLILFAPRSLIRQHASAIHLALCFFFSPFPIRVRTLNLNEQFLSLFAPIYPGQTRYHSPAVLSSLPYLTYSFIFSFIFGNLLFMKRHFRVTSCPLLFCVLPLPSSYFLALFLFTFSRSVSLLSRALSLPSTQSPGSFSPPSIWICR